MQYHSVSDIFPENVSGIQTGRDDFVSKITNYDFNAWVSLLVDKKVFDNDLQRYVELPNWDKFDLSRFRRKLTDDKTRKEIISHWLYRPFDIRPLLEGWTNPGWLRIGYEKA